MDLHAAEALVAEHGADRVTEALLPYLTAPRRARIDEVVAGRMASVHVAVESPSDPRNAAAMLRTAEALGVTAMHVIGAEGRALHTRYVTKGAFHWVQIREHATLPAFAARIRESGTILAGATMDGSVPVERVPVDGPLCILLGNEQRGLSEAARRACDLLFRVPMVGMSGSLNLSVTAAISLYEVMRRKRADGARGDLDATAQRRLRACYYAMSVDDRLLHAMFETPSSQPERATASAAPSAEASHG